MTLLLAYHGGDFILFAADKFGYDIMDESLDLLLDGQITLNSENFGQYVKGTFPDLKIFQISESKMIMHGGTVGQLTITDLFDREKLLEKLRTLTDKKFHITVYFAERRESGECVLIKVTCHNGAISQIWINPGTIYIFSFSEEIEKIFLTQFKEQFWAAQTIEDKISILTDFYNKIHDLYHGLAGGIIQVAKVDKGGFKWLRN